MFTIVIPAYNEAQRIGSTLGAYLAFFSADIHLCVIANGCTDATIDVVKEFEHKYPGRLKHTELPRAGKGAAVVTGLRSAEGEYIGFVDADGATSPQEFKKLLDAAMGTDGAIASRWLPDSVVTRRTPRRMFISKAFMAIERFLFNLPYADTQCGAKIFRASALKKILPYCRVQNMAIDVELLYLLQLRGYAIREVPTIWEDRSSSAELGSPLRLAAGSLKVLMTLIILRIRFIFFHKV